MIIIITHSCSTLAKDQTINVFSDFAPMDMSRVESNEIWNISDSWVYEDEVMNASLIKYYVFLHRKPTYYVCNVILPIIILSLVAMLVFWLPAGSGEKIGLAVTVLLSFTVAQDMVNAVIPKTSDSFPLLSNYIHKIY